MNTNFEHIPKEANVSRYKFYNIHCKRLMDTLYSIFNIRLFDVIKRFTRFVKLYRYIRTLKQGSSTYNNCHWKNNNFTFIQEWLVNIIIVYFIIYLSIYNFGIILFLTFIISPAFPINALFYNTYINCSNKKIFNFIVWLYNTKYIRNTFCLMHVIVLCIKIYYTFVRYFMFEQSHKQNIS